MNEKPEDYIKYCQMYDGILKDYLRSMFKPEYKDGWYISELMKTSEGGWVIQWKKDMFPKCLSSKEQ